jgi:diguanylate cyclase (GGDEF)-like protein
MSSSTNHERDGRWLDLQWEVAETLARCGSIAEAMPRVLELLGSALSCEAATLWQLDGEEVHRVSEWTAGAAARRSGSAPGGFVFGVEGPEGSLGSIELVGDTQPELDERLERVLILLGRQIGECLERDRTTRDEDRLRHLAEHDQLTGLFNRRRFDQELKRELAKAGRYHSHSAVLSVDVDNFKAINDSAGHAAGDAVLTEVADVLRTRFRSSDVVARLGGDEFGVLVTAVGIEEARAAADDLLGTIRARPAMYGGMPFRITASIGVTSFQSDDVTASEVLVNADLAMYAAKAAGRDRVVVYTPDEARKARAMAKLTWSQRIQDALERDRFVLHLQPILELASGKVSHGELLLRMRGDRGKLIAPGAFLPAAERFGLIHAIDRWVVQEAIRMIAGAAPGQAPRLGVNLSGESVVGDPELLSMIERELDNAAVDPANLIFEITETAAIANMAEATRFAQGLTNLGCSLALDDFGTGFGSFYYLKHLPVRYVKLDGEFIHNLPRNPIDEHMVRAIVGVAHGLGIQTVAESVADDETIEMLHHHGVDFAQGFHIGRPAPVPEPLAV